MKKILLLSVMLIGMLSFSYAQNYQKLATNAAGDTLTTSVTFSKTFKISSDATPSVAVQIAIDSVSGTPGATATLYQSLDNVNWTTTGQTATFSTGVDTVFYLVDTLFYGVYGKVAIVATATAQKSNVRMTMKKYSVLK